MKGCGHNFFFFFLISITFQFPIYLWNKKIEINIFSLLTSTVFFLSEN